MGQKINPIGFRLAVRRDWHSQWFARKQTFADQLLLDYQVRNHIEERFSQAMIAKIEIVRQEKIQIKIHCAKPGLIIGSKGEDIEMLRKTVRRMIGSKGRGVELLRKSLRQIIGSKGEGVDMLCKIIGEGSNISHESLDKMFTQLRKTIRPSPSSANDDRRRSPSQVVSISDNIDELLRIVCKMTNSLNSEELPRVLRRIYKTAGSKDDDIDLPKTIRQIIDSEVDVDIREIRKAETNATLVARNIAIQLEKRVMFRRAMRRALMNAERVGVKGIKIMCKGRLNGAEIARFERYHRGRVPLHTLRANIDYGFAEAKTSMGVIGIKVWIFHGETPARLKRDRAREEEALSRKVEISPEVTEETTASEELIAEAQKKEAKKRLRGRYDPNAAADSKPETFSEEDFGDDLDDFYTEGDDAGT